MSDIDIKNPEIHINKTQPENPLLADIGLLETANAEFFASAGGFLGLRYKGETHMRVTLRRVLPFKLPDEYISVADKEGKEIGILRCLDELSETQASLVCDELEKHYYSPCIRAIKSVKDKMGYVYLELQLEGTEKTVAVKDVSKNIRLYDETKVTIFDVDGNRYRIEDITKLDAKSLHRLEAYLF